MLHAVSEKLATRPDLSEKFAISHSAYNLGTDSRAAGLIDEPCRHSGRGVTVGLRCADGNSGPYAGSVRTTVRRIHPMKYAEFGIY